MHTTRAIAILLACIAGSVQAMAAQIMVTLPPLAGIVRMLDPQTDTQCLLPSGADPHHFQLTPKKIEALQNATMLIRTSFDDGGWPLPPTHANSVDLWPTQDHGWLSPQQVRAILPQLAQRLTALNPTHAEAISAALPLAIAETQRIESAWQQAIQQHAIDGVIMQHPSWRRLMRALHVPVLAVLESGHHGDEFGPRQLEQALQQLNGGSRIWLLADSGHSNNGLQWLQQHATTTPTMITLNPLGSCGESWPALMQANIDQLNHSTP